MNQDIWTSVDRYYEELFIPSDAALDGVYDANAQGGLPSYDVTPSQGKFLYLLAKIAGARRILEIGTLGGYSTIWLGRALPSDGCLVTLELDPTHAEVARSNIALAGLSGVVDIRVGPALESLAALEAESAEPFDLIFIDADKKNNPGYLAGSLKLSHPGTVIVTDNVVRDGKVLEAESGDPDIQGIREFNRLVSGDSRLEAATIQTVGSKGYDGFAIMRVANK